MTVPTSCAVLKVIGGPPARLVSLPNSNASASAFCGFSAGALNVVGALSAQNKRHFVHLGLTTA